MDSQSHRFPLLSLPPELIGRVGLFASNYRLAFPVEALNKRLAAIFQNPQSISARALRHFPSPEHALGAEAARGNLAVIDAICKRVKEIDKPVRLSRSEDEYILGVSALVRAVRGSHLDVVKLLFARGATNRNFEHPEKLDFALVVVNDLYPLDNTALQLAFSAAAANGNLEVVKMMRELDFEQSAEFQGVWRNTVIGAAQNGYVEIVDIIAEMKEGIEGRDKLSFEIITEFGPLPLMLTFMSTRFESYKDLSTMFLDVAARRQADEVEAIRALLDHYAKCNIDLDASGSNSWISSALGVACGGGRIDAAKLLVDQGVPFNLYHFSLAAGRGKTEMLEVMFDILEKQGEPMPDVGFLFPTSRFNQISTVRLLLKRHPASRAQAREALVVAERHGWAELVRTIISIVPESFEASDEWIERATTRRHTGAVKLILRHLSADIRAIYSWGDFWDAVREGYTGHLAGAILGFGNGDSVRLAAAHLLPISASEGAVRTMKNVLRKRHEGQPLADIHAGDDAALVAAVEASMLTSVTFLLSHGASVGAQRGRALKRSALPGNGGRVGISITLIVCRAIPENFLLYLPDIRYPELADITGLALVDLVAPIEALISTWEEAAEVVRELAEGQHLEIHTFEWDLTVEESFHVPDIV
ncbi:hypothetical protein M427DRAFT_31206 [Gonapodya prolifera JEL478]|uniref:Ankyrin n=1 Tax=Gonapodya prolifera (strain JEL478) TaxID=1344416 RepID=A0A139AIB1_GONPJ|nr:hypothetical protein M427DRAFT_31206 [Gonapodya prolifera JEL478]|eukprot:KXS16488.1 hypothetical protein M427DRAFT_31206 [Gonapodya prolifera JEL478]